MTTKNTLEDLKFAETFVLFVSRRSNNKEQRARAKMLISMIEYLDTKNPSWRRDLLDHLDKNNITKSVDEMFNLPEMNEASLYNEFMTKIVGKSTPPAENEPNGK